MGAGDAARLGLKEAMVRNGKPRERGGLKMIENDSML